MHIWQYTILIKVKKNWYVIEKYNSLDTEIGIFHKYSHMYIIICILSFYSIFHCENESLDQHLKFLVVSKQYSIHMTILRWNRKLFFQDVWLKNNTVLVTAARHFNVVGLLWCTTSTHKHTCNSAILIMLKV